MTGADNKAAANRTPDGAIFGVVFLLVFAFSYSEEIVRAFSTPSVRVRRKGEARPAVIGALRASLYTRAESPSLSSSRGCGTSA
jgi:hypothetical protein